MALGSVIRTYMYALVSSGLSFNESYTYPTNNSARAVCSQDDSFTSGCLKDFNKDSPTTEPFTGESFREELLTDESLAAETLAGEFFTNESFISIAYINRSFTAESVIRALYKNESFASVFYKNHVESFANNSITNNSFINGSFTRPSEIVQIIIGNGLTLTSRLVSTIAIAIACASAFNNSLLLWAIPCVDKRALKAKYFIQNLTITNLLLPVIFASELFCLTTLAGLIDAVPNMCVFGIHSMTVVALFLSQSVCVLSLASDRIYAVVRPLTYNTIGYSKRALVVILIIPWIIASVICGSFFYVASSTLPPTSVTGEPSICFLVLSASLTAESSHVLDSFLISANLSCFFVYISLFVAFKYQQRTIHNMSMTNVKKTNVSLVRVYFLLNITTLVLYLPAPIFAVFQENAIENDRSVNDIILGLFSMYLLNTCLDPIILMSRIPSIRQNLPIKYKPVGVKRATESHGTESVTM